MSEVNWWTYQPEYSENTRTPFEVARKRVHFWLASYPQLQMAIKLGCSLDAGSGGDDIADMRRWERHVTTKADLDMALKHCTERQQEAVKAKFHEGLPEREAAKLLTGQPDIHRLCQRAIDTMAEKLSGDNSKTGE